MEKRLTMNINEGFDKLNSEIEDLEKKMMSVSNEVKDLQNEVWRGGRESDWDDGFERADVAEVSGMMGFVADVVATDIGIEKEEEEKDEKGEEEDKGEEEKGEENEGFIVDVVAADSRIEEEEEEEEKKEKGEENENVPTAMIVEQHEEEFIPEYIVLEIESDTENPEMAMVVYVPPEYTVDDHEIVEIESEEEEAEEKEKSVKKQKMAAREKKPSMFKREPYTGDGKKKKATRRQAATISSNKTRPRAEKEDDGAVKTVGNKRKKIEVARKKN